MEQTKNRKIQLLAQIKYVQVQKTFFDEGEDHKQTNVTSKSSLADKLP